MHVHLALPFLVSEPQSDQFVPFGNKASPDMSAHAVAPFRAPLHPTAAAFTHAFTPPLHASPLSLSTTLSWGPAQPAGPASPLLLPTDRGRLRSPAHGQGPGKPLHARDARWDVLPPLGRRTSRSPLRPTAACSWLEGWRRVTAGHVGRQKGHSTVGSGHTDDREMPACLQTIHPPSEPAGGRRSPAQRSLLEASCRDRCRRARPPTLKRPRPTAPPAAPAGAACTAVCAASSVVAGTPRRNMLRGGMRSTHAAAAPPRHACRSRRTAGCCCPPLPPPPPPPPLPAVARRGGEESRTSERRGTACSTCTGHAAAGVATGQTPARHSSRRTQQHSCLLLTSSPSASSSSSSSSSSCRWYRLHTGLCVDQWARWHSTPQYHTRRHAVQVRSRCLCVGACAEVLGPGCCACCAAASCSSFLPHFAHFLW